MSEKITIKRLGPIEEASVEIKPLTVLVGEQASGKSLVAQVAFFFKSLKGLIARYFNEQLVEKEHWHEIIIKQMLDQLRGVPFGYFSNGTAQLRYETDAVEWSVKVYRSNRAVNLNNALKRSMDGWVQEWRENKETLGREWKMANVFIPTERSIFTRLSDKAPTVLYADYQPLTARLFYESLDVAKSINQKQLLSKLTKMEGGDSTLLRNWEEWATYIGEKQKSALKGSAYVPKVGPQSWKWRVDKGQGKYTIIPIEATASGQMEAWPFFVIASTLGVTMPGMTIYFEEPETHLHPAAQVDVIETIGFMVKLKHHFFITTHSPYVLYVINNMMQRFMANRGHVLAGNAVDPRLVASYRISAKANEIMDQNVTKLIDATELERVANEIGGEFDRLLDEEEEAGDE